MNKFILKLIRIMSKNDLESEFNQHKDKKIK